VTEYLRVKAAWVVALIAGAWGGFHPLVQTLLILMALDFASGLLHAASKGTVSSDASWNGMRKKAMALVLIGAAHTFNATYSLGFDAGAAVAGFFCATEFISITENAGKLGLPLPKFLVQAIDKLRKQLSESPKDDEEE
jgi:toxin secretion/phage lysis holin